VGLRCANALAKGLPITPRESPVDELLAFACTWHQVNRTWMPSLKATP